MMTAVKGYYNGNHIVMDEDIELPMGQEVIVTVLDMQKPQIRETDSGNSRMQAYREMEATRLKIKSYIPEDFDPEKELAEAMEEKYGRVD